MSSKKIEIFIDKANKVHKFSYDYSKSIYITAKTKLIIICKQCKFEFNQIPNNHLSGQGCPRCGITKSSDSRKITKENFIEKSNIIHNNCFDYSYIDFTNNQSKIRLICKICGHDFKQRANNHLLGVGCPSCAGNAKMTTEIFVNKANKIHKNKFDYSLVEYKNSQTDIIIICRLCNNKFNQNPSAHIRGNGCKKCGISAITDTKEMFIDKARNIHGHNYDYSNILYINSYTNIIINCKRCNTTFEQTPHGHLSGNGCRKCFISDRTKSLHEFIEQAKIVHKDKYDYSFVEYINTRHKVILICNDCNFIFDIVPDLHISGRGCRECFFKSKTKNTEQFIKDAISTHKDKYDYSEVKYIGCFDKVIITCKRCNCRFEQVASNHLAGSGCFKCANILTKPEIEWLNYLGIPQEWRQTSIKVGGKLFKPDALDPNTNTIYEMNGDFYHGNPAIFDPVEINPRVKKTYGELFQNTLNKHDTLVAAGYKVISIWESEWHILKRDIENG